MFDPNSSAIEFINSELLNNYDYGLLNVGTDEGTFRWNPVLNQISVSSPETSAESFNFESGIPMWAPTHACILTVTREGIPPDPISAR
ncbi:MAG: hypothetical protein RMN51_12980 [Verrucomicrobiota bacterium]|nr:hypothetical protein [Limisphaera sp.]MDW8383008.1 hypothetical protein [Verrucomicrobiota bacterium]